MALDRLGSTNEINPKIAKEIEDIENMISMGHDIGVIVITGKETFLVGTDRDELALFKSKAELIRCLSLASIIEKFDQPPIVAFAGHTLGQGLNLEKRLALELRLLTNNQKEKRK